ncbi:hypothetical protein RRH01S_12_00840 [Rhizobium rhizogenes NBRC 13257]|uniref:Transposase n=1 Tax=Rhizobium rhizogenes NBRC 13257 TaxID=1220581 RepID=A0AA87QDS1_RHIRH|nr:hypothetical protein RRH01S_12_00840 [Rhizobium rhizogenes NBRC 13257]
MTSEHAAFIGLDISKLKISVAIAEGERNGEVRFLGDISSEPSSVAAMVKKLAKRGAKLHFCLYEEGQYGTVVRVTFFAPSVIAASMV